MGHQVFFESVSSKVEAPCPLSSLHPGNGNKWKLEKWITELRWASMAETVRLHEERLLRTTKLKLQASSGGYWRSPLWWRGQASRSLRDGDQDISEERISFNEMITTTSFNFFDELRLGVVYEEDGGVDVHNCDSSQDAVVDCRVFCVHCLTWIFLCGWNIPI